MTDKKNSNLVDVINMLISNVKHDMRSANKNMEWAGEYLRMNLPQFYERIKKDIPQFQDDLISRYGETIKSIERFEKYLLDEADAFQQIPE